MSSLITVSSSTTFLGIVCCILACKAPGASYRYRDPIVFQRKDLDDTGDVRLAGKVWVMESDGSHLRQLTFGEALDDHPAVYSDLTHVLFTEYARNALFDGTGHWFAATVVKQNIYTGAREVLLVEPECSIDHVLLVKDTVLYARACGAPPRLGPEDPRREVRIGIGPTSWSPPFAKYIQQLAGQKPMIASEWKGPPPVEDPCSAMGGHHSIGPDGTIFFECKTKDYQSAIAYVNPKDPNASAKLFYNNGRWNHHLALSHDGRWIVWASDHPPQDAAGPRSGAIMLAKTDGSHVEQLSDAARSHPIFSRDGKAIIFDANLTDQGEMWRFELATRKLEQLTHSSKRHWTGSIPLKRKQP